MNTNKSSSSICSFRSCVSTLLTCCCSRLASVIVLKSCVGHVVWHRPARAQPCLRALSDHLTQVRQPSSHGRPVSQQRRGSAALHFQAYAVRRTATSCVQSAAAAAATPSACCAGTFSVVHLQVTLCTNQPNVVSARWQQASCHTSQVFSAI